MTAPNSSAVTYFICGHLKIHAALFDFVNDRLLPGTGVKADDFWQAFSRTLHTLAPRNRALLARRDFLQQQIDQWHCTNLEYSAANYQQFLRSIRYLLPDAAHQPITTQNVDAEIATIAGPQLVVPVINARFALNACNARWGSLYDALYGTDVIEEDDGAERGARYNPVRGEKVISFGRDLLDVYFPLAQGSYHNVKRFFIETNLFIELNDGNQTTLADGDQFCGFQGKPDNPTAILLRHNGLHIEIQLDRTHAIGAQDAAGIKDLLIEAALTTIMDCEDSVAAVDAEDKILVYQNWLGLMRGDLTEQVQKNGDTFIRHMNPDREYTASNGETFLLLGRSLMLVRNVGHHMMTDAVLDRDNQEIPEGILDGFITCAAALHDLKKSDGPKNSRCGSIYVVKPKMHGPEEVAFANDLFAHIENALQLPRNTIKMGIMDEERRTTVNLGACIYAARERVVFINTGFLDRTGDEIHTSMQAGAFAPKNLLKTMPWLNAYESWNVATGLACGLHGKAQIGKGMWAQPDNMSAMIQQKIIHPKAGANTAWVPSPTAATLHAIHYHEVDVMAVQKNMLKTLSQKNWQQELETILTIPLIEKDKLRAEEIQKELDNNCQSILGYVVRWIDQGIGCSKVPDASQTPLMEDRATLRISSQHIANWLHHGICTEQQVIEILQKMAEMVDQQNQHDAAYQPMANNFTNNIAFIAARDLILKGKDQANGYTEFLLHHYRRQKKGTHLQEIVFAEPGSKKVCGYIADGDGTY